jgi:hypothetical protein
LDLEKLLQAALRAREESEYFDFKREFDGSTECWVGFIKDLAAFANSGGGVLLFGLTNDGQPSGADLSLLIALDPAKIADKFRRYAGIQPASLEKRVVNRNRREIVAILIGASNYPVPFVKPGTYPASAREHVQQRTEFSQGTVYFRHGAKSETAEHIDFVKFYERRLDEKRKLWFEGIRQVIEAPEGTVPMVSYGDRAKPATASIGSTKFVRTDPDRTHPYTPSELLRALNRRISGRRLTNYDILAVRFQHSLDAHEEFVFQIHLSSPRYSDQFAEWILACYEADPAFFDSARESYRRFLRPRLKNNQSDSLGENTGN